MRISPVTNVYTPKYNYPGSRNYAAQSAPTGTSPSFCGIFDRLKVLSRKKTQFNELFSETKRIATIKSEAEKHLLYDKLWPPLIVTCVLNHCEGLYGKFSPSLLNAILKLADETSLEPDYIKAISFSVGVTYNTPHDIDYVNLLAENLPEDLEYKELYNFINERIRVSLDQKGFKPDAYKMFNEGFQYIKPEEAFELRKIVKFLTNKYCPANISGQKDFIFKLCKKYSADEAYKLSNYFKNQKNIEPVKVLAEAGINEIYTVVEDLYTSSFLTKAPVKRYVELFNMNNKIPAKELASLIRFCHIEKFHPKIYKFIKENIEDEDLYTMVAYFRKKDGDDINMKKVKAFKRLNKRLAPYTADIINHKESRELLRLWETTIKNKDALQIGREEISDEDINTLLFEDIDNTLNMVNLVGEKAFFYSFKDKYDMVEFYIETLGGNPPPDSVIQIFNPENSELYKKAVKMISFYKNQLKTAADETERANIINKINEYSSTKNKLLKNAVKDPKDIIDLAVIFMAIDEIDEDYARNTLLPLLAIKNEDGRKILYQEVNNHLAKVLDIFEDIWENHSNRPDFSSSKYFPALFKTDYEFKHKLNDLITLLDNDQKQTPAEIFNQLKENIDTKAQFEKEGINYDNWVNCNPDSNISICIKMDSEKMKQNTIKNLESDINDELFEFIPKEETEKLFNSLEKSGITVKDIEKTVYDEDGFLNRTEKYKKFFKNNKPIEFEDIKTILETLKEEINKNEFWNRKNPDTKIENAKETLKNHLLKLRFNELHNAKNKKLERETVLKIQKADMNDIIHSLFLGNDACCCTAVDGCNGWSAPNYIMNKLVSCIEIISNGISVGNTMCYFAEVDGKISLILDNIEIKPQYQFNEKLKDGIIEYAKKLTAEVGKPDMPIYAGPNRHKVNLDNFDLKERKFRIIGSTGNSSIYLDFDADEHQITGDEYFEAKLYKIR